MPDFAYLDHAALSPVDARVAAAMAPWQAARFGNPSALYRAGREAGAAATEGGAAAMEARREAVVQREAATATEEERLAAGRIRQG